MIQPYVNKIIDNLPKTITLQKEAQDLYIIFDGLSFNGNYHHYIGAIFFLKEMEKRNYIKVQRISGSNVGSIIALLYLIDTLEIIPELYNVAKDHFTKNHNLDFIKQLYLLLKDKLSKNKLSKNKLSKDLLPLINNRLFISYNNVKTGKKKVKSVYKNIDDIFTTILKSCYIPYLIDGNIAYNNKYIGGCIPYIFKKGLTKETNTKILYLDLFGNNNIWNAIEKTTFQRSLIGLLDIHAFFIKQTNTSMCSYIDDWTLCKKGWFYSKYILEKICVIIVQVILYVKNLFPFECKNSVLCDLSYKLIKEIISTLINFYLI